MKNFLSFELICQFNLTRQQKQAASKDFGIKNFSEKVFNCRKYKLELFLINLACFPRIFKLLKKVFKFITMKAANQTGQISPVQLITETARMKYKSFSLIYKDSPILIQTGCFILIFQKTAF